MAVSEPSNSVPMALRLPGHMILSDAVVGLADLQRAAALQTGAEVTLDTADLAVFDTSAVAVLLELRRNLADQGKTLKLANPPKRLQDLIGLYGVAELLPV